MYGIVIHTNKYAGNFEREVCAWVTGHVGECGVGKEMVVENIAEKFLNIQEKADENGCMRPVEICEDNANNLTIFFSEEPSKEQLDLVADRCDSFNQEVIKRKLVFTEYPESWKKVKFLKFEIVQINKRINVLMTRHTPAVEKIKNAGVKKVGIEVKAPEFKKK